MKENLFNKLSIVIPAYNEGPTIHFILDKLQRVTLLNNIEKEIIIVNDCSKDNTEEAIKKLHGSKPKFKHTIF